MARFRLPRPISLAAAAALLAVTAACQVPALVPGGSATCGLGSSKVTVFQGPSGRCLPRNRLVEYRCVGRAPEIVIAGTNGRHRRFLGGGFATEVAQLPPGAQVMGVGQGTQAVVVPGQAQWLYTVQGDEVLRWLALPLRGDVEPAGPQAFMIGDSILDGGQDAIAAALPGWTLGYDALNGRSSLEGISIAQTRAVADDDVVVVELGTNDRSVESFRDHARQILSSLEGTPLILWQSVQGPADLVQADAINAEIRTLVGVLPNAAVADWAGEVGEELLSFDGIHPDLTHEDAMAKLLAPMLHRWLNAVTAVGRGCG